MARSLYAPWSYRLTSCSGSTSFDVTPARRRRSRSTSCATKRPAPEASSVDLQSGHATNLQLVPNDGAAHPTGTYVWSDGLPRSQSGLFIVSGAGHLRARQLQRLDGGDNVLLVTVDVIDSLTHLGFSAQTAATVHCTNAFYTTETPCHPFQDPSRLTPRRARGALTDLARDRLQG